MDECPTCYRPFEDIRDYPKVFVHGVEIIKPEDIPDTIQNRTWTGDYNHAPNIKEVFENDPWVKQYLSSLDDFVGKEISPADLLPKWDPDISHGVYHLIPGTSGWYMEDGEVKVITDKAPDRDKELYLCVTSRAKPETKDGHKIAKIVFSDSVDDGWIHLLRIGSIEYDGLLEK